MKTTPAEALRKVDGVQRVDICDGSSLFFLKCPEMTYTPWHDVHSPWLVPAYLPMLLDKSGLISVCVHSNVCRSLLLLLSINEERRFYEANILVSSRSRSIYVVHFCVFLVQSSLVWMGLQYSRVAKRDLVTWIRGQDMEPLYPASSTTSIISVFEGCSPMMDNPPFLNEVLFSGSLLKSCYWLK